jgi:DNA-binding NarL/FixJ family response regulator
MLAIYGSPESLPMQPIRILVVDDHPLLREGVAAVIEGQPDMTLVAEATFGGEAITMFREHRPDITLMDLRMPDISGIDAIRAIRSEFPAARIVVLTTYAGDVQALGALKAGAAGYLLKSMLRKDLLDTIRTVHAGKRHIPPEIAKSIAEHAADDALTDREIDVLQGVGAGRSNKQIALQLGISEGTVKAHMKNILPKLGARDRTHAVMIAVKRGILDV